MRTAAARALAQTCPSGSAYDATLVACAVTCDGGYVRDDTANTTIDTTTVLGRCDPCAPGSAREAGSANACVACPSASSSAGGQPACVPCSYQGVTKYANASGAVTCLECPAGTMQRAGDETDAQGAGELLGVSLDECACEPGAYDPVANRTGAPCEASPEGRGLRGDTRRPTSKPLYYGCPPPHDDYSSAVPPDDRQPVAVFGRGTNVWRPRSSRVRGLLGLVLPGSRGTAFGVRATAPGRSSRRTRSCSWRSTS